MDDFSNRIIPDVEMAIAYLNELAGRLVVNKWDLVKIEPGFISFRIPKRRFPTLDTEKRMLTIFTRHFGQPGANCTASKQTYFWDFGDRRVYLEWVINKGTFVELYDYRENS